MGSTTFAPTEAPYSRGNVDVQHIDLFDYQPCDVLVIPCSDAGTISSSFNDHLYSYGVHGFLLENRDHLYQGNVFPIASSRVPALAFAVTVQGTSQDTTNGQMLFEIGVKLATLAKKYGWKTIACPLLGTGAGGIPPLAAFEKLVKGFLKAKPEGLKLVVCIPDQFNYKLVDVGRDIFKEKFVSSGTGQDSFLNGEPDITVKQEEGSAAGKDKKNTALPPDLSIRLARYEPDTLDAKDAFSLRNELTAFANLIASRELKPPLSIGLFGNWGAGKSFFMRSLELLIKQNSAENQALYHSKIAHITFNAWHYMDANLWASLMTHILSDLSKFVGNKTPDQQKQEELFRQLDITKSLKEEVDVRAKAAANKLEGLQKRLKNLEEKKEKAKTTLHTLTYKSVYQETIADKEVQGLLEKAKERLQEDSSWGSLEEINTTYQEYTTVTTLLTTVTDTMFNWRGRAFYFFLLFLTGLTAVGAGAYYFEDVASFYGALLQLPAVAAVIIAVVKMCKSIQPVLTKLKEGGRYLQRAAAKVQDLQRAAEKDLNARMAILLQEYQEFSMEELEVKRLEEDVKKKLDATLQEIRDIEQGKKLDVFLERRIASSDYSQHLGLIALLRNDLDRLCTFLQANEDQQLHVDRIVLYIDDLDRCPPDKVVEVLQAVHLLLAFPLFVVVVGVDVRWIKHAVAANLFGSGGTVNQMASKGEPLATPLDYLEKIFQIPYKLKVPGVADKVSMLRDMLQAGTSLSVPLIINQVQGAIHRDQAELHGTVKEEMIRQSAANGGGHLVSQGELQPEESGTIKKPEGVNITVEEQVYMEKLLQAVTISPRSLKRFVNTFRLIKANPDWRCLDEQGIFLYRETLYLLAISICCAEATAVYFHKLKYCAAQDTFSSFMAVLKGRNGLQPPAHTSAHAFKTELESLSGLYPESEDGVLTTVAYLQKVAEVVVRFSFNDQ